MAREIDFPVEAEIDETPLAPLLEITHQGFLHATGEDLRTPDHNELLERLKRGLASLDNDFPNWLEGINGETADGLVLRFRDLEALRNVASKLRDRGVVHT